MNAHSPRIDLDAYFERIGFDGRREASLETLSTLHLLHPQAIPFENLDPLLGRPVRLDPESIQKKLVAAGRGGYCYEHNLLFQSVVDALGFRTRALAARVVWGRAADAGTPPRTHMLLLADLPGGTYLADVGFGGMTLSAPLALEPGREQETPHGLFRIDALDDAHFLLQTRLEDTWMPVYRFDLEPQFAADFEMANHFVATHPASNFVRNLMVARLGPNTRYGLLNRRLNVYGANRETREIASVAQLRDLLQTRFGIRLPDAAGDVSTAELDAALARLP
jgi:N-hydroxyarylamine O-acetyltransferase